MYNDPAAQSIWYPAGENDLHVKIQAGRECLVFHWQDLGDEI